MTQLSSATAMPITEAPWKTLQVLPAQIVLETAEIDFPVVRGETRFLIQWIEGSAKVVGATEVRVYPTNLLAELNPLLGDGVLGIFDPQNELKPLLANAKVAFVDLENSVLEDFRGQLAIIGPFESGVVANPPAQVKTLSEKGVAIVWIQSRRQDSENEDPQPSFYCIAGNPATFVIVQPEMTANLVENPRSQLNLIYFCKLVLHPHPLTFPPFKK